MNEKMQQQQQQPTHNHNACRENRRRKRPWSRRPSSVVTQAIASILLWHNPQSEAISANPNPILEHDENGNLLHRPIYLRGDESYHWYEDERGYTLIDDPAFQRRGNQTRKVYATINPKNGNLVSTGVRFGSSDATINRAGFKKHVKPSINLRKAKCGHYCEDNPTTHVRGSSVKDNHRRNLQEHTNRRKLMTSANSLRNLVVLIRFSDHQNRALPSVADYNVLMNGPGAVGTVAPTGSVNDVFLSNSYGVFSLESTVYPWVTVSNTESYYADSQSGLGPKIFEAIHEALDIIDQDPNFDFSHFNTDFDQGDAWIDAITVFHSGYGAEFGGIDCYGTETSGRIWSHSWFMYTGSWTSQDGTVSVSNYHINPGIWGVCGSDISRIGVVAHETSHFLGLPDLYDPEGGNGIGIYCLMSDSWGIDGSQLHPPMLSPWSRTELGWVTPMTIDTKGDYTLNQSWQYPEVYKIDLGSDSEYLLIENRQPGSYDSLLPLGGLAIWHIDEHMYLYGNSLEGYPGQNGWPSNSKHYYVALLQADGRYDLERGDNSGDYSDLFRYDFYFGVDHLFPSESDPLLGPFPNTDSYRQGVVSRTNHFISGISATGPEMTFSFLPSSHCQPGEIHFELTLLTDGKGYEVSWSLLETYSETVVLSGSGYANYAHYNVVECVSAKCHTFVINDAGNNGLTSGYGGYSVRLNGLKVASGNDYGSRDENELQCMIPPTISPTSSPIKPTIPPSHMPSLAPSLYPSSNPSVEPTLMPTGVCGRGKGLLEIIVEGDEFVDEISWYVRDMLGNIVLSRGGQNATHGGLYSIRECIDLISCYTFSIHDSLEDDQIADGKHRGVYSVKLDKELIVSGHNFGRDQTTMFGVSCLLNGDAACTMPDSATPMSMFRLELAGYGVETTWSLANGSKETVLSAGPFGQCHINSLAMCLPREDCYEFTIIDGSSTSYSDKGLYTVMFSHTKDMVQNYTGPVLDVNRVLLGTCYDTMFDTT